ncbi:MAG: glycosyltransferase [Carboxylicivirga sp.]|jgi:glycosyltransferase involved in cell wall biosynthesis|nr:glycosyltransferase [Carboxylicivirga sp.]
MIEITYIIATYNAEDYLERCLKSIGKQKTERTELFVIDGESKDNTQKIIEKYQNFIDYTISEPDKGVYDAWNKGVKKATGNWIQFIGADDMLLPNSIANYLQFIDSNQCNDVDIITAKSEYVNSSGRVLQYRGIPFDWAKFRKYMCLSHGSTLHSRRIFEEVGLYNLKFKICGDYELLLRKADRLNALFYNQPVIRMQAGGLSFTVKGQIETYEIKKYHKSIDQFTNLYHLVRGVIGFVVKKVIWRI